MDYLAHHERILYDTGAGRVYFPNIYKRAIIDSVVKDFFGVAEILHGERPDQMAMRLYEDHTLWWTFFFVNEKLLVHGWPMIRTALRRWLQEMYGDHMFDTVEYVDMSGNVRHSLVLPASLNVDGEIVNHWIRPDRIASTTNAYVEPVEAEDWFVDGTDDLVADGTDNLVFSDEMVTSTPAAAITIRKVVDVTPEDIAERTNEQLRTIKIVRPEFMGVFLNDYAKALTNDGAV